MNVEQENEVIVIGAGMAGLAAARALAERGLRVVVLEALDRVGGRVFSQQTEHGVVVEHGAEFIHGRSPELWALIKESGVETTERDGEMLRESPGEGLTADDDGNEEMFSSLEELTSLQGEDKPFAEWLASSKIPKEDHAALLGFVEGFNAADARRIGIHALGVQQKAEDETEGERAWHVHRGYSRLAEYLADRLRELHADVHLGCEVLAIRWSAGQVEVETSAGTFHAKKCVVTLPLGVMQRVNRDGQLRFEPEPAAISAARRLEMGHAARFTLVFRERWWESSPALDREKLEAMSFLFTTQRMPPVWWTRHPETETLPTLTGWVGGPRVAALQGKSAAQLAEESCATLAEVFHVDAELVRTSLLGFYMHDWSNDPHFLGAYSYVPAGALDAPAAMSKPEADTLFFAGEHTDTTGNWGTVHAAIRSGLRAAQQVLGE